MEQELELQRNDILSKLNELTSSYDFVHIIVNIIIRDFVNSIHELNKRIPDNHFIYKEVAFLIGLWIKNYDSKNRLNISLDEAFTQTDSLMSSLHQIYEFDSLAITGGTVAFSLPNESAFIELFFYGSTTVFPNQYIKSIKEKYKYDENWLSSNKKFKIEDLSKFFYYIVDKIESNLNSKSLFGREQTNEEILNIFCITHAELVKVNSSLVEVISSFSLELGRDKNDELIHISDYNKYETSPIIKLKNNTYFIPIIFYLAQSLYESPYYWMLSSKAYKDTSLLNRGRVGEEIVYNLLISVFGPQKVFKSVKIEKQKGITVTDVDVLALFNNSLIIFQVKAKRLTSISKQGNIQQIKDDYEKAIENAFTQGIVSKDSILHLNDFKICDENNIEITHLFKTIKNIYIICIVLDVYPGLTISSHLFLYDRYNESTICFNIFELEIICKYLSKPDKFVDYVHKRINNCRSYVSESETSYLSFYLKHDLMRPKEGTRVIIDNDYSLAIDRKYISEISGFDEMLKKTKIGRNDKCPCGSGLKYKKCHGLNK